MDWYWLQMSVFKRHVLRVLFIIEISVVRNMRKNSVFFLWYRQNMHCQMIALGDTFIALSWNIINVSNGSIIERILLSLNNQGIVFVILFWARVVPKQIMLALSHLMNLRAVNEKCNNFLLGQLIFNKSLTVFLSVFT